MANSIRALDDRVFVDPYYDPEKIGSLYIPDGSRNEESNQGVVIAAGPNAGVQVGDYVLYHSYKGDLTRLNGQDVLPIRRKDLVARAVQEHIYPMPDHVMLLPDWKAKYEQPSSLIHTPDTLLERHQPAIIGRIVKLGLDVDLDNEYPELSVNQRVLMQPSKGSEIGWVDTVFYFLRPKHILACLT